MDIVDPRIEEYAESHSSPLVANLDAVAARTRSEHTDASMMVGRLEGAFLEMLVHLARARFVLEVGTFTGFSAIAMASALPPGGRLVTCEVDPEHAAHARQNIAESGLGDRIELREGPALETIESLPGPFDLVFIDADKTGYLGYYTAVLGKLSDHGLVVADNTFRDGDVLEEQPHSDHSRAIKVFNDTLAADQRVRCVQLTIRDGVTLARRLPAG